MAEKTEPWGATTAGLIAALFTLVVDKVLLIDKLAEHQPLLPRVFFVALIALAAFLSRQYYLLLNGADESLGSDEREEYDALRQRLSAGGKPTIVYNRWLTIVLAKVDQFFGDAGRNDKSWIARALHLETDGPRWTAPAFDKCLLLALVYPVITIFAVWVYSGHVGVAEHALLLSPNNPTQNYATLTRVLPFACALVAIYAIYKIRSSVGLYKGFWFVLGFLSSTAFGHGWGATSAAHLVGGIGLICLTAIAISGVRVGVGVGTICVTLTISYAVASAIRYGATHEINNPILSKIVDISAFLIPFVLAVIVWRILVWVKNKRHFGLILSLFFLATFFYAFLALIAFPAISSGSDQATYFCFLVF